MIEISVCFSCVLDLYCVLLIFL